MEAMILGVLIGILSTAGLSMIALLLSERKAIRADIAKVQDALVVLEARQVQKADSPNVELMEMVEKYEAKIAQLEKKNQMVRTAQGKYVSAEALEEADPEDLLKNLE